MEARQTTRQSAQTAASARRLNPVVVAIIAIAAVTIALVAIVVSTNNTPVASLDAYNDIPMTRLADGGFVIGSPEAPITIVEFADFACPHCQDYSSTMKQLVEDYVATGMARLEYRMFVSAADPVYGPYTAQLAECAENQREGAFWQAHDILFELGSRARFNDTTARTLADRMGLSYSDLLTCTRNASQYQTDMRLGQNLGIQSTPSIMVRFGSGSPQFIQGFTRGPVPYQILQQVVLTAQ